MAPLLKIITASQVSTDMEPPVDAKAREQAGAIIDEVQRDGEKGLLAVAVRLGDVAEGDTILRTCAECKAAYDSLPADQKALLDRTAARIRGFAETQRAALTEVETELPGGAGGHRVRAVRAAGCYAPGGRYPLPSSVLMTAVTARAAGVTTVVVASPRPTVVTLAAAYVAGADFFMAVGGAQAIAAMAFGVGSVPPCDVIVGPGNKWVTAAKAIVAGTGRCAIDMLAGPSEVLVIADGTANPTTVAADLLAQAEHDVMSRPIVLVIEEGKTKGGASLIAAAIEAEVARQLEAMPEPNRATARTACGRGFVVVCADVAEAVALSDAIAPEHLEIQTADADDVGKRCSAYGGLFVGSAAAEVLGDYGAGPNHVLPTGGTGKHEGGLSVFTFLRVRTWMRIDAPESAPGQQLVADAVALARLEGLEGHARAAEQRLVANPDAPPPAKRQK